MQIGAPIYKCPNCGHFILDTIAVEYEFMTDAERRKFSTNAALPKSYIGNIIYILFGIFLIAAGIACGKFYIAIGLIFGGGAIWIGISQIIQNHKYASANMIEQCVYQSLKRTSNKEYVELLKKLYAKNKIKREYRPFYDKENFLQKYAYFDSREEYKEEMAYFEEILSYINTSDSAEKNNESETHIE